MAGLQSMRSSDPANVNTAAQNPNDPGFQNWLRDNNYLGVDDSQNAGLWAAYQGQGGSPGSGTAPPQANAPGPGGTAPAPTLDPNSQTPPSMNMQPATLAQQFPNGIPGTTPATIGSIPQVTAQEVMAPQVSAPGSVIDSMGGPGAYSSDASINAMRAYMMPQFDQQNKALDTSLANAGIIGGTSARAHADLGNQQQTQFLNDVQPYVLSRQQMQQAGATTDVGNNLQRGIVNAGMNLTGQQSNQQAGLAAQGANQQTGLAGGAFNAGQINQGQQFNTGNQLAAAGVDTGSYNDMLKYIAGLQQQQWLAQLGSQTNIATAGMGAQTGAFNPVFNQPQSANLGGIASAFTKPAAPTNYNFNTGGGGTTSTVPGPPGSMNNWIS